ncbi:MAG: HEAT repeat domain-containing protein [Spirochaetaceae bacterium]|jgi:hypothetical protein|nr:HEAT repeat domain-containing protein [Spirochaetaceae bacterium]
MYVTTNEKRLYCAVFAGLFAAISFTLAQDISIEESYLRKSVETMIIREQALSGDRDTKFAALKHIRQLMDNGDTSEDLREILSHMALEGILNKTRLDGRIINNFPDVRMKAVEYLGDIKDKESTDALIRVLLIDDEPYVVTTAVKALTKQGFGDGDYSMNIILHVFTQYDSRMPSNVLALSVIDSCNSFMEGGKTENTLIYATLLNISNNPSYVKPVRDYAGETLEKIYSKKGN